MAFDREKVVVVVAQCIPKLHGFRINPFSIETKRQKKERRRKEGGRVTRKEGEWDEREREGEENDKDLSKRKETTYPRGDDVKRYKMGWS